MLKSKMLLAAVLVSFLGGFPMSASAQLADKKTLTLEAARKIAAAAEAEAAKNKWGVVIAIVDDGGHLVYLQRIDGTQTGSIDVAIKKAQTAMAFKRPTKVFEDAVAGGRNAILALPGALPLEGGVPLSAGGQIIGAIGVSGVTAQQDGQIAKAGADALAGLN
jgi:glc operon protein GlcG